MSTRSEKRYALVTGGASGMGLAIVERLAAEGLHVYLVDRDEAAATCEASRLANAGLQVEAKILDLMDEAASRELIAELPALQVLVNNAGIFDERGFFDVTAADFQRMYAVNMLAVATLTQAAAQKMAPGSRIVNIASRAYLGAKNHPHYVASKAALVGYTRACAMELAAKDILVNAIAPGVVDGEHWDIVDAKFAEWEGLKPGEKKAAVAKEVPIGRFATADDIKGLAVFLASKDSDYILAQTYNVDGGNWMS